MANKDYTVSVRLRNPARATDVTSSNNPSQVPEKDVDVVVSAATPEEAMDAAIKQVDPEGKYEARGRAVNEGATESESAIRDGDEVDFGGDTEEGGESDGDDTYLEDEDQQLGINEDSDAPATTHRARTARPASKKKIAHKKR